MNDRSPLHTLLTGWALSRSAVWIGFLEAASLGLTSLVMPALIPTAVCGLVLERATRYVAELPAARGRHIGTG